MKKSMFMLGVAVAALASCTQNEVVDIAESNVIKFDNAFVGNTTKAVVGVDNTSITNFYVYAKKGSDDLFTNENVFKNGNAWGYDNTKLWEAGTYVFAAYSNGGNGAKGDGKIESGVSLETTSGNQIKIADYEVGDKNRDLVASVSTSDLSSNNNPVEFTFKHTLAKIKFTIESSMGDVNKVTITDFEVTGLKDKATLTFDNSNGATWTTPAETRTISNATFGEAITSTPAAEEFVVIPQNNAMTVKFKASITVDQTTVNKELTATIPADNADLKANMCYNYIATIKGTDMDIIEFAAPVITDWEEYTDTSAGDLASQDVQP